MTRFIQRLGQFVEADEAFEAWMSADLDRMLAAISLRTNAIDRHFLLQSIVKEAYQRRRDPKMRRLCIETGRKHLFEFADIAASLAADMGGKLPTVRSFAWLATALAEDGQLNEAIATCEAARSPRFGGWDQRWLRGQGCKAPRSEATRLSERRRRQGVKRREHPMKRDMDLARKILLEIEACPSARKWVDLDIPGHTPEEISYHVMLLAKAGLIDAVDCSSRDGIAWKATNLSWEGHEFIEAAKDETRWAKAKDIVVTKGGGIAFDLLKQVLVDLMKRAVLGGAA